MRATSILAGAVGAALGAAGACAPFGATTGTDAGAGASIVDGSASDSSSTGKSDAGLEGSYRAAVMSDGPVAYFRFDEAAGASTVLDDVTGRELGAVVKQPQFGAPGFVDDGGAVTFDGESCITLGDRFGFADRAPFTIEVWTLPTADTSSTDHLFTKQDRDDDDKAGYALIRSSSGYALERFQAGDDRKAIGAPAQAAAVSHIAVTYDGGTSRVFVNGGLRGETKDEISMRAHAFQAIIGGASDACEKGFEGTLDELAVFDKALTEDRIKAHVAAGARP